MIWMIFSVSIVMAFLLAGVESALLTVSRLRVRHAASEGDKTAVRLMSLLEHRNELVQVAIAVNHLFALAAFVSLALALSHWFGVWCILLALLIALPVFLIGLELFPKWLFRRYPFRILKRLMPLLGSLRVLAGPWLGLHRWVQSAAEKCRSAHPAVRRLQPTMRQRSDAAHEQSERTPCRPAIADSEPHGPGNQDPSSCRDEYGRRLVGPA